MVLKPQDGKEACVEFKNMSRGEVLIFTQEFSGLLYSHITHGMAPEIVPEPISRASCRTLSVIPSQAAMYGDL